MRKLLVATQNKGKLEEMRAYLKDLQFEVLNIDDTDIPSDWSVDEVGETFEGNALIKAIVSGKKSGLLTIADDSGISIDVLGGEPGVKSARYADGTDKDRYQVVLEKMQNVPEDQRSARFTSVVAIYDPENDRVAVSSGHCDGVITREPKGERGFGYDPIFYVAEIGKTYAEATLQEKMSVDHRGKAMKKAVEALRSFV